MIKSDGKGTMQFPACRSRGMNAIGPLSGHYGQDQEQHLAALRLLRDQSTFVMPMHWYPCEVLELVSYSQPEGSLECDQTSRHWIRAFACAALLRANEAPWSYSGGANPSFNLIQLINSIEALPVSIRTDGHRS